MKTGRYKAYLYFFDKKGRYLYASFDGMTGNSALWKAVECQQHEHPEEKGFVNIYEDFRYIRTVQV